jgi:hypothetical protein
MRINYWLIYVYAQNNIDYKHATCAIHKAAQNLNNSTGLIVILFGPTLRSTVITLEITRNYTKVIASLPGGNQIENTRKMISIIKEKSFNIQSLCLWGHGSGWIIGPWKTAKVSFMTIPDFVKLVVVPLNIKFICYDACYMGSISSLYEHPSHVKVIVASPAFHPYTSLLQIKSFGKLPNLETKQDILTYARKLSCEWHIIAKEKFKCLLVFDTLKVKDIAHEIQKHSSKLLFDRKNSQIDKEESNLHDLSIVARNVPSILSLNKQIISSTCPKCIDSCAKRVHGISIERHLPRKWQDDFKSTKWYKEIFSRINYHSL